MKHILKMSACSLLLMATGCSEIKSELGLDRHTPDEFAVMQRAPLEIPTDLHTLPKPQPGLPRPQDVSAKEQAQEVILGTKASENRVVEAQAPAKASAGENALMNRIGTQKADTDIRQKVTAEQGKTEKDNRSVVKRLMNIGDQTAGTKVVDAQAEAKRIQDAKKAGKPITEGSTPSIDD